MKDKVFKKGDKVTYKNVKDCTHRNSIKGGYYYGGEDQGGYVGEIMEYVFYVEDKDCWSIHVRRGEKGRYLMLESEFLEYDKPQVKNELFPIY